jgi:hypothetical protein
MKTLMIAQAQREWTGLSGFPEDWQDYFLASYECV